MIIECNWIITISSSSSSSSSSCGGGGGSISSISSPKPENIYFTMNLSSFLPR